jgi:hypothetical protein
VSCTFATLAALLVSPPLLGQAISVGLRTGIPYTLGPAAEISLWRGIGLGADLLLRRSGLTAPAATRPPKTWQWELPITLVFRFRAPARPFLRSGVTFNRVRDIRGATGFQPELRHRAASGVVAGGGLRFQFHKLSVDPEVRLTRWFDRNFGVRDSAVRSNLTQIGLLVGVVF